MTTPATASPKDRIDRAAPRLLLLGLGNDILSDDAIGLHIVRAIRPRLSDLPGLEIQELSEMGLALLDHFEGFDQLILVDAVQTGRAPPGFLHEFDGAEFKLLPMGSPHFLGLGEILALARELSLPVPEQVRILAVEVEDPFTVGTDLGPCLLEALPALVEQVIQAVRLTDRPTPVDQDAPSETTRAGLSER